MMVGNPLTQCIVQAKAVVQQTTLKMKCLQFHIQSLSEGQVEFGMREILKISLASRFFWVWKIDSCNKKAWHEVSGGGPKCSMYIGACVNFGSHKRRRFAVSAEIHESEKENIMLAHLAPLCGTASAARNKRRKALEQAGFEPPVPLRSKEFPMGLPSLKCLDASKVLAANRLYDATFLHRFGINLVFFLHLSCM